VCVFVGVGGGGGGERRIPAVNGRKLRRRDRRLLFVRRVLFLSTWRICAASAFIRRLSYMLASPLAGARRSGFPRSRSGTDDGAHQERGPLCERARTNKRAAAAAAAAASFGRCHGRTIGRTDGRTRSRIVSSSAWRAWRPPRVTISDR